MIHALRSRGPWGLIVAAVAVAAIESLVARLDTAMTRPESFDRRLARLRRASYSPNK